MIPDISELKNGLIDLIADPGKKLPIGASGNPETNLKPVRMEYPDLGISKGIMEYLLSAII